ncbi:uncharacterized protein LOC142240776 [Haematobia irritans]|uniref:uncharacterized protein LOC142240776 n=1 Tax=Haematobia irritans TaxID=7368 RepID=UPI003F4F8AD5
MANTVFKYHQQPHHHHQHQHQQQHQPQHYHHHYTPPYPHNQQPHLQHNHNYPHHGHGSGNSNNNTSSIATIDGNNHNQNNSNQNSIFVLNAETKISPNSCRKFYLDFNDNPMDACAATLTQQSALMAAGTNGLNGISASSVWSSASSTMCSPAAHAIQKLFNCSSGGGGGGGNSGHGSSSTSKHHGNYSAGIDSKSSFKTSSKSELLKKKSKFWQYLEGETAASNGYEGIEQSSNKMGKSRKHKSKYWPKSNANDNQNSHNDLSELLEYSCSLCDNCRCMDCQIGYFDCDNSDDSNSEYSFHMNAYDEDDDEEELKATITASELTAQATTAAGVSSTSTPSSPSSTLCGDGGGEGFIIDQFPMQNSLGCNKMDNKNTIQQLEFENSNSRNNGNHAMAKHLDVNECCHQCYGLEVESQQKQQQQQQHHCLDFHQIYTEAPDDGDGGGGESGEQRHHHH